MAKLPSALPETIAEKKFKLITSHPNEEPRTIANTASIPPNNCLSLNAQKAKIIYKYPRKVDKTE